jgi:hypothetical protein
MVKELIRRFRGVYTRLLTFIFEHFHYWSKRKLAKMVCLVPSTNISLAVIS